MASNPTQRAPVAPETGAQPPADTLQAPDGTHGSLKAPSRPDIGVPSTIAGELFILQAGVRPIPDYVLVSKLGSGGFGEVWKAIGPGGFAVALKFLKLEERTGATELRSLDVMRDIRHPHLLAMFATWKIDSWLIIAMELGDRTLHQRLTEAKLQKLPGIPLLELLEYMREAAKGIDHLNELGIQHRDIKPQNFLLVGGGLKVADFGLAKILESSFVSNSGSMTPAYAAPEFFQGQTSPHSDQYSLAVTYCQLRGGKLPFEGNAMQIMFSHLQEEPNLTMLPVKERATVTKALAKRPEDRWPSCRAFVNGLYTACGVHNSTLSLADDEKSASGRVDSSGAPAATMRTSLRPLQPPDARQPPRRTGRWIAAGLFLGLLGLAAAGAIYREPLLQWAGLPDAEIESASATNPHENALETEVVAALGKRERDETGSHSKKVDASKETKKADEALKAKEERKKPPVEKTLPPIASIQIVAPVEPIMLRPGPMMSKRIQVKRINVAGPIQVKLTGVPDGVTAKYDRIPAALDEMLLDLQAPIGTPDRDVDATISASTGDLSSSAKVRILIRTPPLERDVVNSLGMKLRLVPAGKFQRGSPTNEPGRSDDESLPAETDVAKPFYLGVHEVTQDEYERVVGKNPSWFRLAGEGETLVGNVKTGALPVESVTWNEAVAFCQKLSEKRAEKDEGRAYRLPTESEWEYACRAGATTAFHGRNILSAAQANFLSSREPGRSAVADRTVPVGSFSPNAWGLFDMHGNVFEWCQDEYIPPPRKNVSGKDAVGPAKQSSRVIRGGAWCYTARHCRSAARNFADPDFRANYVGFRVALTPLAAPMSAK